MVNSFIHCTRILRRVDIFHTYCNLFFWFVLYLNYGCCLYNADELDNSLFYFLTLQHAVVVFLVKTFLFRFCILVNSLEKIFNISFQVFLLQLFFILHFELGFLSRCSLYYLKVKTMLCYFKN